MNITRIIIVRDIRRIVTTFMKNIVIVIITLLLLSLLE